MPFKIKYDDDRMPCGRLIIKRGEKPVQMKMNVELPMAGHKSHMMIMITSWQREPKPFDNFKSELMYIEKKEAQALVDYIKEFFNLD